MLEVKGLSKAFGGLAAVDQVSLDVGAQEIVALIGPNGAGKTTLFACIAGFTRPDGGRVRFLGRDVLGLPPQSIGARGIALARALATRPKLLLLDEVMAGLNPIEVEEIVGIVRAIKDAGVVILLIEHVMQAVVSLAERVYVLSNGRIIASGSPTEIAGDPSVIEAYLGPGAAARLKQGRAHA